MYFGKLMKKEPEKNRTLEIVVKIAFVIGVFAAICFAVKYYCKKHNINCFLCNSKKGGYDDYSCDLDFDDIPECDCDDDACSCCCDMDDDECEDCVEVEIEEEPEEIDG